MTENKRMEATGEWEWTHLFHCETSYTFSQLQIYLLFLLAPPLMKIRDVN